jgi:hypothetical protein
MHRPLRTLRLTALAFLAALTAPSATFSFQGTFSSDDQVQLFDFTLPSDGVVTFQSLGYGGGVNATGTVIPSGGFDSYLTWYAEDGTLIGSDDDSCGAAIAQNGACLDAYFTGTLTAGNYFLALTQSGNNPTDDLADGFTAQGIGNFTCPQGFCDYLGNQNTGNWAVDIAGVSSASAEGTPEPGTTLLCGLGLLAWGAARRRFRIPRTNNNAAPDNK